MTESAVSICNKALIKINAPTITALTDESNSALYCNQFYPQVRNSLLEDHPWNFATARVGLQQDGDDPVFGYNYQFLLPTDCLRVLDVVGTSEDSVDYDIEGRYVLANYTPVSIRYIKEITDTTKFSYGFIEALVDKLASELAYAIAGSQSRGAELQQEFEKKLRKAKRKNGQEGSVRQFRTNSWLNSRS